MVVLPSLMFAAALAAKSQPVLDVYDRHEAQRLVPMLSEVIRFPTVQFDDEARTAQQAWLLRTAASLGLVARDAGKVTEIELPGPDGAPVLGLVVHGDVQPVEVEAWSFPPFAGKADGTYAYGRGVADDKGPLVQALLAMTALRESGIARTHTIRLLVGSDEESDNKDIAEYLVHHAPPDYSLVLDSEFPAVVGEKAWNSLTVTTPRQAPQRPGAVAKKWSVAALDAGLSASIVPDRAEVSLRWDDGAVGWQPLLDSIARFKMPEGTRVATQVAPDGALRIVAYGKSAHAGVNIAGGRNALVALARLMEGKLPGGSADDLLAFVRLAGRDLSGTGLGITDRDPLWGTYVVNVATIKPDVDDPKKLVLTINIRSFPPRTGKQLQSQLAKLVADFCQRTGAQFVAGGYYGDVPLVFDPNSKLVRRLLDNYAQASGKPAKPAISGGGTYAKRLPNAIAFGMWFPGKPYPGHDVDEKIAIEDLQLGTRILIETLTDIATGPKIIDPFK